MMTGMGARERDSRLLSGGYLCSERRIRIRGLAPRLCPAVAISIRNHSQIRGDLRSRISRTGFLMRNFSGQMGTASGHAHVRGIVDIFATWGRGCFGAYSRLRSEHTTTVSCLLGDCCVGLGVVEKGGTRRAYLFCWTDLSEMTLPQAFHAHNR